MRGGNQLLTAIGRQYRCSPKYRSRIDRLELTLGVTEY
jgi:hypothetical protein